MNREAWHAAGQQLVHDDLLPVHISSETKWTHWRSPLKLQIPWLVSAYISRMNVGDSLGDHKAFFVSMEEGFIQYPRGPVLDFGVMAHVVNHLRMLRQLCCLQLRVSQVAVDSHPPSSF